MAAKKLKPETINMRGAAVRSIRMAFRHYLDWELAQSKDLDQPSVATLEGFLRWAELNIKEGPDQ